MSTVCFYKGSQLLYILKLGALSGQFWGQTIIAPNLIPITFYPSQNGLYEKFFKIMQQLLVTRQPIFSYKRIQARWSYASHKKPFKKCLVWNLSFTFAKSFHPELSDINNNIISFLYNLKKIFIQQPLSRAEIDKLIVDWSH